MAFLFGWLGWLGAATAGWAASVLAWADTASVSLTMVDEVARRRPRIGVGSAFGAVCCLIVVAVVVVTLLLVARRRRAGR